MECQNLLIANNAVISGGGLMMLLHWAPLPFGFAIAITVPRTWGICQATGFKNLVPPPNIFQYPPQPLTITWISAWNWRKHKKETRFIAQCIAWPTITTAVPRLRSVAIQCTSAAWWKWASTSSDFSAPLYPYYASPHVCSPPRYLNGEGPATASAPPNWVISAAAAAAGAMRWLVTSTPALSSAISIIRCVCYAIAN